MWRGIIVDKEGGLGLTPANVTIFDLARLYATLLAGYTPTKNSMSTRNQITLCRSIIYVHRRTLPLILKFILD